MSEARLLAGASSQDDAVFDRAVRPRTLDDEEFIGQASVKRQMRIFITAARNRNEALDHTLIFGHLNISIQHSNSSPTST